MTNVKSVSFKARIVLGAPPPGSKAEKVVKRVQSVSRSSQAVSSQGFMKNMLSGFSAIKPKKLISRLKMAIQVKLPS